ncbi:MAG: hypothetical protein CL916_14640 [Deltaproteobacteria bacterium]|nr:hypothetical protein [Deltaproteobacteria bacterium]
MSIHKTKIIFQRMIDVFIVSVKATRKFITKITGIRRKGFIDYNNIGMSTRDSILFRDAETCVLKKTKGGLTITGSWKCRYSGKIITNPKDIEIDHIVPINYAKNHKIGLWTPASFQEFENDTDNLIAVSKSLNRAKKDKSLVRWKPPKNHSWYKKKWTQICKKWTLENPS